MPDGFAEPVQVEGAAHGADVVLDLVRGEQPDRGAGGDGIDETVQVGGGVAEFERAAADGPVDGVGVRDRPVEDHAPSGHGEQAVVARAGDLARHGQGCSVGGVEGEIARGVPVVGGALDGLARDRPVIRRVQPQRRATVEDREVARRRRQHGVHPQVRDAGVDVGCSLIARGGRERAGAHL